MRALDRLAVPKVAHHRHDRAPPGRRPGTARRPNFPAEPHRGLLARLVGAADADDLTQDVFEKAERAISTFRGESRVGTWLYRVATNVAIDRLRDAGRRAKLESDGGGAHPSDTDTTRG